MADPLQQLGALATVRRRDVGEQALQHVERRLPLPGALVEPAERVERDAILRVDREHLAIRGDRTLDVVELALEQVGHLEQQRDPLERLGDAA